MINFFDILVGRLFIGLLLFGGGFVLGIYGLVWAIKEVSPELLSQVAFVLRKNINRD